MPRYRERPQATGANYHSDDPRQTDLEQYIAAKNVTEPAPVLAGRPPREPTPTTPAVSPVSVSRDNLIEEVKRATDCGFLLIHAPPGSPSDALVCVKWDSMPRMRRDGASGSGRGGWFHDEDAALRHVIEYERISAEQGKDAAERFHSTAKERKIK